ncbi:MAG: hypothetical protein A2504_13565 [Bdellovibrionales bacterium RIFOXYD12_FULL_39_22]|nr:MAG: hypothetical protein A2385_00290 [Bdellovibrionales bacterium RIFOXYB1_FULL_39_21]OFZ43884.1 MAG: hypothetical protein A2485_05240 [Bdellovibrionales bacterium RIFOXYC12_FULL_39_17]OFZ48782.1 MAG: hypothetical protein A2404_17605 [Bdellovibrionales bacterium RIFOXYC1_FULL_39_130]OFZ71404.1 MAG: hypothetical protein A2451_05240 [Bdellovibrionales bacterium RIFOXYC2_FULL_39_8]OFZ76515.1 MAG: hypothetical protein A2560_06270 [Bdellovibrionales bacterium RIFOXYD1_FULL_39_84]OFZ94749.1 MAG:
MSLHYQPPFNIIITGIGGQGISRLTKSIWTLSQKSSFSVQGAIFKGGAQTLGSVYSTMRIFFSKTVDYEYYSSQILERELDLLIALEPYEALRFQRYFGPQTKIICSSQIAPIWIERHRPLLISDPIAVLRQLGRTLIVENFHQAAMEKYGDTRAAGEMMFARAREKGYFPWTI